MKTNEEVLQFIQEKRRLMDLIWRRKKNWISQTIRGESLLKEVIEYINIRLFKKEAQTGLSHHNPLAYSAHINKTI